MKNEKRSAWILQFQEINKLMEDQLEKWKSIEKIRKTYDEFVNILKKLTDLQPDLEKNLDPVQKDQEEKYAQLIEKTFPVANILTVYRSDHNVKKGDRSMVISQSALNKLKKKELLDHAGRMMKTVEKHYPDENKTESELSQYGLTPVMVEDLQTAIHQYEYALKLHKDLLSNRSRSENKSGQFLKVNRKLLEKRLDRLMTVFSSTHPSFYQEYTEIRKSKPL